MKKQFTVCASPFDNGICEVTVKRVLFGFPVLMVSIEGYIAPNDTDDESIKNHSSIIADAYRKVHLLNLICNHKHPRRNK